MTNLANKLHAGILLVAPVKFCCIGRLSNLIAIKKMMASYLSAYKS